MSDRAKLERLIDMLHEEFARCMFPNGREAYMREFEEKFEISVHNMKIGGGIDRSPNKFWIRRSK